MRCMPKLLRSVTGAITEADPAYSGSQAANITETGDITNLGNLSGGTITGDQDITGIAHWQPKQAIQDTASQIRSEIFPMQVVF